MQIIKKIKQYVLQNIKKRLTLRSWFIIMIGIILAASWIGYYLYTSKNVASANWAMTDYKYRQRIPISNGGSALTDYQMQFTVNTSTLISSGKLQRNCEDLRFVAQDGSSIPYWVEENNPGCNDSSTVIWVKLPSIPTTDFNIYMYYGNPSASAGSSGSSVFPFFDDFNSPELSGKWSSSGGTYSVSSGELAVSTGSLYTTGPILATAQNYVYESRIKWTNTTGSYGGMQIADVVNPQGSNSGANALVYLMGNTSANYQIIAYGSDGSATGYGITSGTAQFTATANTYQVAGYSLDSTSLRYYNNRTQTNAYTGTWTEAPYMNLGFFTGSIAGTTDHKDITVDWVLVRKYAATIPTAGSFGSEETTPEPIAIWKFDEGNSTKVNDSTEYANTGTFGTGSSAPAWQTKDACISGTCLFFDGTNDYVEV